MSLKFPVSLVGKRLSPTFLYDNGDEVLVKFYGDIPNNWNDNNTPYNATRLEIGTSCTNIGDSAFFDSTNLTGDLVIPNSVTSIGATAFRTCGFSGSLFIPSSVTSIDNGVFSTCGNFTSLSLNDGLESIGNGSFSQCTSMGGTLVIPSSVTSIGFIAFSNSSFTRIEIYATTAPNIDSSAFNDMSLVSPAEIHVPSNATGYPVSIGGFGNTKTIIYDLPAG